MSKPSHVPPPELPDSHPELVALTKKMHRKAASIRARTRGRLGEVMATTLFPREIRNDVQIDRAVFSTPFGQRRIDNYLPQNRQAVESKYLRITANSRVRLQIAKDKFLLDSGALSEVVWVLYYGGSPRTLKLLAQSGIQVVANWDELTAETKRPSDDERRIIRIRI